MTAETVAKALGNARKEGLGWRCRCPIHGGGSLTLRDGERGRLLVCCFGGCDRRAVFDEIRRRDLLGRSGRSAEAGFENIRSEQARTARALAIWSETQSAEKSIVAVYLNARGIRLNSWPRSLRFHPTCPRPRDAAGDAVPPQPAMVALVQHAEHGPVAVHATYLRSDGGAKANIEKPKVMFGPVRGGAVHLGAIRPSGWFVIGEGIESTLSVTTACGLPGCAALSANGLRSLILPAEATMLVICADHDQNGVGQAAASDAADRFLAEGRRVRIATPRVQGSDFNDMLRGTDRN